MYIIYTCEWLMSTVSHDQAFQRGGNVIMSKATIQYSRNM